MTFDNIIFCGGNMICDNKPNLTGGNMTCDNKPNLTLVIGVGAGVLLGLIAGIYIYISPKLRANKSDEHIHDSAELIAQCRKHLKEIENGLATLKSESAI